MTAFSAPLARDRPDEVALRDNSSHYSWAEVDEALNRFVNGLLALDLGPETRIAIFAENSACTALAHIGGLLAGASVVPINFHLTAEEVAYILGDAAVSVLFVDDVTADRGLQAVQSNAAHTVIGWNGAEGESLTQWNQWLAASSGDEPPTDMTPLPNLLYTSGTTGLPKGTPLPPNTFAGGSNIHEHLQLMADRARTPEGTQLVVGPMYHTGPLGSVRALAYGRPLVVLGRFDAQATLQAIETHSVKYAIMVPTHFVRLLALSDDVRAQYDLSCVEQIAHTGSKCSVEVKRAMIDWLGPVLFEAYGASEVGVTNSITSEEWLAHPGSVGKAVPPFDALILDDDDQELPVGQEGRLYFRDGSGRGIIYHNAPEKSAEAHIAPGVFTLGEIAYMDEDGYVYITDRFSDMIVSGGVNIYPAESEQLLINHPVIEDVACIGIPHAEMGEELRALVILKDSVMAPEPQDLIDWARERLSHYKCPRSLEFVSDLGRNTMGKINKRRLKAAYWS